jgi:hypothetical protein
MSDTILAGKLTVYYLNENRRKQIKWTGTTDKTDVQKQIDVYDATEDLFTVPTQQDDGLIYSAETPGEMTIGRIDAGDAEPWFIDLKTMEHIIGDFANFTGCALKTSGWTRSTNTDTGIVVVAVDSGGSIVAGDIGDTIYNKTGSDRGTLLDFIDTGTTTDYLWIRPEDELAANDWDSATGSTTMATSCNEAIQNTAAATGEMVWGNFYTQGALITDTHVYVLQDGVKVTAVDQTDNDWWPDGQVDRAIPIKDWTTDGFPTIDEGYLTVKAAKYSTKYTYAVIRMNTSTGGNVSAGLSSGLDITNTTGYKSVTTTATTNTDFYVGDEINGGTSGARAVITQIDGTDPTFTFHYYLIGDPLTDFQTATETITNADGDGSATKDGIAPANQGPNLASWFDNSVIPTYTYANNQVDVDDDGTDEEYGITIDVQQALLAEMHERNKYQQRRGSTVQMDAIDGEQWIGIDYAINYATITGTVPEGSVVTGSDSLATGVVVSNPAGTSNTALLRNSRGTFLDDERIYETDGVNEFDRSGLTVEVITPVAESSLGTLAGVNFFASRGVVLTNYKSTEENLWSTIDAGGTARARPTTITMEILNLLQYDYATCLRLTGSGGVVDKTEYACTGGEAVGDVTLDLTTAIAADVPGKTVGSHLTLVDWSDNQKEYVLRFLSYTASTGTCTLANLDIASADATTNSAYIREDGSGTTFQDAKVGDLVLNKTQSNAVSYVSEVTSGTAVTIFPNIAGQTVGDAIELNAIPVITTASDYAYFYIVFEFKESDGSASASMQYVAPIYSRVKVRNTGDAAIKIKGFSQDVLISTSGGVATATRIENTVYGS